jgi:hypothetical protein
MAPKVKTAKNSKLPENCFESVGKGGRPPDRFLYFIVNIEEISGLTDVEMQSEYDDKMIMIRMAQRQHGDISLRLVWNPGITVIDNLTSKTNGIVGLHRFDCWEYESSEEMIEGRQEKSCDSTS